MTFSSIGLRHLLWDLGQSLGIWSHKCSPLFICGVNLRRYKIHKSFSTMPFIQQLLKYKTFTEAGTSREAGRSDSCKVCLYGSMRFPWGRGTGLVGLKSCLQTKRGCVSGWFHYWRQSNPPVIIILKNYWKQNQKENTHQSFPYPLPFTVNIVKFLFNATVLPQLQLVIGKEVLIQCCEGQKVAIHHLQ